MPLPTILQRLTSIKASLLHFAKMINIIICTPSQGSEMGQKLSDIKPGQQGRIVGFAAGDRSYRQRLLAMGATPGTTFEVLRVAPLGDPLEVLLRGFTLSLRKHESDMLIVEAQA